MTDFQPTLPAEIPFSDAELSFLDESPPGLYPENQNSNFGYVIRKIFSDRVQDLINQLDLIYSEKFVSTSLQYLDEWERSIGLPVAPTSYTTAQRRSAILNRLRKGAFTHARRQAVVESFITATFGAAPAFSSSGLALDSGGIGLYSDSTSLAGTYVIRENQPWKNLVPGSGFEVGNLTGSPWMQTLVGAATGVIETSTDSMFGSKRMRGTAGSAADQVYVRTNNYITVDRTKPYALSAYFKQLAGSVSPRSILRVHGFDASNAAVGYYYPTVADPKANLAVNLFAPTTAWARYGGIIPANAMPSNVAKVHVEFYPSYQPSGAVDIAVDGVQLEQNSAITDFANTDGTAFEYEVRILNTLGVDIVGLTRELARITPAGISFTVTQTATP